MALCHTKLQLYRGQRAWGCQSWWISLIAETSDLREWWVGGRIGTLHECLCLSFLQNSLYSLDLSLSLPFCFPCSHCAPCSERRKRLFVQDPLTCKCSCKFTQLDCKSRQLELNERTCRFVYHTYTINNVPFPYVCPSLCFEQRWISCWEMHASLCSVMLCWCV